MFSTSKRTSRSVDYLIAALSPLEVSRATHRYLESLPPEDLERLIECSTARLDDDERAYLEMVGDFGTFLEQNRRALRTLDRDSLRAILMPVIAERSANVEPDDLRSQLRAALPPISAEAALHRGVRSLAGSVIGLGNGVVALGNGVLAFDAWLSRRYWRIWKSTLRMAASAVTPLSIIACGAAIALFFAALPHKAVVSAPRVAVAAVKYSAARTSPVTHASHAISQPKRRTTVVAAATVRPATPAPKATPTATPTQTSTPRPTATPAPVHVASAPKPAVRSRSVRKPVARAPVHVAAVAIPSHEAPLVQRARLIVMSYLDSLMRGDASAALGNLGLSASAGTSNLTEAPILAGATEFRIVKATLNDPGTAKIQVMIDSPQGRYFGDYIVSANGPAAWITQHEVIPVESTVARHN